MTTTTARVNNKHDYERTGVSKECIFLFGALAKKAASQRTTARRSTVIYGEYFGGWHPTIYPMRVCGNPWRHEDDDNNDDDHGDGDDDDNDGRLHWPSS